MTAAGFRARIYAVEWHANLWRLHGTPVPACERMMRHCSECIEADYYGVDRPITDDPHILRMQNYLDRLFHESTGPQSFA